MHILVLGGTSEIAKYFCYHYLDGAVIYLTARRKEQLTPLKNDLELRGTSRVEILEFDATKPFDLDEIREIAPAIDVFLVAVGYLGLQEKAENEPQEAFNIIDINFRNLVPVVNLIAMEMKKKRFGTIVGISSVAGERGRGSNFFYGSAKAALSAYLSGLRNTLHHSNVHVVTVLPGFIDTKMTAHLNLPKPLTSSPKQVAARIFKAVKKSENKIYVLGIWRWIMLAIGMIPESIFKKMKL